MPQYRFRGYKFRTEQQGDGRWLALGAGGANYGRTEQDAIRGIQDWIKRLDAKEKAEAKERASQPAPKPKRYRIKAGSYTYEVEAWNVADARREANRLLANDMRDYGWARHSTVGMGKK